MQYLLNIRGNTLVQTGGDEETVAGALLGRANEAMGGVLERAGSDRGFWRDTVMKEAIWPHSASLK